jgi:ketosteroid isomerase-like protein
MDLQHAADWVEIFQLKSKYSWYYDTPEFDKLMDLFTEDAVLDMGPYGKHTGREEIRQLFAENISSPNNNFPALHATTNPLIEIDGDDATGQFYLLDTVLTDSPDRPTLGWGAVYYENYRRENGRWLISRIRMRFLWNRDLGRVKGAPPKLEFHADAPVGG